MKIVTIIGARPQIIKAAAISRAIKNNFSGRIQEIIVHTGQHYDENMSAIFFEELEIPQANYNLSVGSGSHGKQTGKMIEGIEEILIQESPDALLVYGDTNSTLAGALAAVKIHIPVIHIEAGLRSFNKSMPEEINRIACDHSSTILFSPTQQGIDNLLKEGFTLTQNGKATADQPHLYKTGDIMYDNSMYFSKVAKQKSQIVDRLALQDEKFILCTIHRDSNTDNKTNLENIFRGLLAIQSSAKQPIVLPLHPRTKKKIEALLSPELQKAIHENPQFLIIEPAGFIDMISLESRCNMVITDSGGVQKEAFFFQKPCIILREQTEWVEIVENGNAILVGSDDQKMMTAYLHLSQKSDFSHPPFFGDGNAAVEICRLMLENL